MGYGHTRCRSCGCFVPDSHPLIDGQCANCGLWSGVWLIIRGLVGLAIAAVCLYLLFWR